MSKSSLSIVFAAVLGVGLLILGLTSTYVVDEGRIGVIRKMGQAVSQERPNGLQFKSPITSVDEYDVRERTLALQLTASTSNQLSTVVDVSVNWRPKEDQILYIAKSYGSPEDFSKNILAPRLQQSLKATVGQFTGAELTQKRNEVANAMYERAVAILEDYPAEVASVQLENFALPPRYMEAVMAKEEQREATGRQKLYLEQQDLVAKERTQTAQAEADATKATADGEKYRIEQESIAKAEAVRREAQAEADGIKEIQAALSNNPLLVEYERAKRWNGQMPSTVLGNDQNVMLQLGAK